MWRLFFSEVSEDVYKKFKFEFFIVQIKNYIRRYKAFLIRGPFFKIQPRTTKNLILRKISFLLSNF
jgi:chromosome condensin MukBEF MukE localization factor